MNKVLYYLEPHPIRNTFVEFRHHALALVGSLFSGESRHENFVYSNREVLNLIKASFPETESRIIWPSDEEQAFFASNSARWDASAIRTWVDLAKARGDIATAYGAIFDRLLDTDDFKAAVIWGDNGAVARAADRRRLPLLHCELGPTRPPFPTTFYVDFAGVNGAASFRRLSVDPPPVDETEAAAWISGATSFEEPSPAELARLPLPSRFVAAMPYVFVPLQLADDANTLVHSPFDGPRAFLASVLPPMLERGYSVVVKGHPGVATRPMNLVVEAQALDYAASLGDRVLVIDRHAPADEVLPIIANAAYVCSINSSVGFEAMHVGVRTALIGEAAYDIGGKLMVPPDSPFPSEDANPDWLLGVMHRYFLHPYTPAGIRHAIDTALDLAIHRGFLRDGEYDWPLWFETFGGTAETIAERRRQAEVRALGRLTPLLAASKAHNRTRFRGKIAHVGRQEGRVSLRGWAVDTRAHGKIDRAGLVLGEDVLVETCDLSPQTVRRGSKKQEHARAGFALACPLPKGLKVGDLQLALRSEDGLVQRFPVVQGPLSRQWRESPDLAKVASPVKRRWKLRELFPLRR